MNSRRAADQSEDVFFDQWLMPGSDRLHALTRWAVNEIEGREERARGRRASDQRLHEELVGAVVANLARAILLKPDWPSVAIVKSRNVEATYKRTALRQLPRALENLEAAGLLTHLGARRAGLSGTIEPSAEFTAEVERTRVLFSDFARHPDEEVLELGWSRYEQGEKKRDSIPFAETSKTRELRQQVRQLNAFLEEAKITIEGGAEAQRIGNDDRRLHRHFTVLKRDEDPRWNLNGRLFGGFWQNLPKTRRHLIRIEGTKLADLDYQDLFLRLTVPASGVIVANQWLRSCQTSHFRSWTISPTRAPV